MSNIRGASAYQTLTWVPEVAPGFAPLVGSERKVDKTTSDIGGGAHARSSIPRTQVLADLLRWEGDVHHLYLDKQGFATVGVGNLINSAARAEKLPFVDVTTGAPATRAQIDAAFEKIRQQSPGHRAQSYVSATDIRLSDETVRGLVSERLDGEFLPGLRGLFPNFEGFPQPAQRALIDMSYNLGLAGLARFEHLRAACDSGDWKAAAAECHRRTCRAERNDWAKGLFLDAAGGADSSAPVS